MAGYWAESELEEELSGLASAPLELLSEEELLELLGELLLGEVLCEELPGREDEPGAPAAPDFPALSHFWYSDCDR